MSDSSPPPEYHNIPATGNFPSPPCYGTTGEEGKRFYAIYMYPADRTADLANKRAGIRQGIADANWWINKGADMSDGTEGNGPYQHSRWVCTPSANTITVTGAKGVKITDTFSYNLGSDGLWGTNDDTCTKQTGTDSTYHYFDIWCSLKDQVALGLGSINHSRTDRLYAVFLDLPRSNLNYGCYWGWVRDDTRADPASNVNNTGPNHLQVGCPESGSFQGHGDALRHEMGHNLGAVQLTAPHSTNGHHCTDVKDIMCYYDSQLKPGTSMQTLCSLVYKEDEFDCNRDDYSNPLKPHPMSDPYWSQQWNIASSNFLSYP